MLQEKKERVIYILHRTLSPLQNPQATEDSVILQQLAAAALREEGPGAHLEECGILVRGRLYNPLQCIFIYITRDRKMQDSHPVRL